MYQIEQEPPSLQFKRAWEAAGRHLDNCGQGGVRWIHAELNAPMVEHFSFLIGNQLFFIFVDAAEKQFDQWKDSFVKVSNEATAIPCVLPMKENLTEFRPNHTGWGLIHAESGESIDPIGLVSEGLIEMSNWELHDMAIQVVRQSLEKENRNVFSALSSLHVDPSIWFEESGERNWVVVRAVKHPQIEVSLPNSILDIKDSCSAMGGKSGYFAAVNIANGDDPFDPMAIENGNFLPIYRGFAMEVEFGGLIEI